MARRIIDFHTHLFSPDVVANREGYLRRDPVFHALYENPKAAIATVDDLLAAMDSEEVEKSVACGFGWTTPELCTLGNDAIIDAVQRHPERIVGFGTIAPHASLESALDEIERLAAAGIHGLGELRPDTQGLFEVPEEGLSRLADALRRHQMALLFHASEPVGHDYPGKEDATPGRMERLLSTLSDIPVVLAHAGGGLPFFAYMPEVREALKDVYVDTAALPYLYDSQVLQGLVTAIGGDKVLFGSDYPLMLPQRVVSYVEESGLSEQEKEALFFRNAEHLLTRIGNTASGP